MAIKIPSKNVFSPIEHSLIKKNKIDKVNVASTVANFNKQNGSNVYGEDVWGTDGVEQKYVVSNLRIKDTATYCFEGLGDYTDETYCEISHYLLSKYTWANVTVYIPKHQYDGTITKLYDSFKEKDSTKVGLDYTLQYRIKRYRTENAIMLPQMYKGNKEYYIDYDGKHMPASGYPYSYYLPYYYDGVNNPINKDIIESVDKISKTYDGYVENDKGEATFSGKLYDQDRTSSFRVEQKANTHKIYSVLKGEELGEDGKVYSVCNVTTKFLLKDDKPYDFVVSSSLSAACIGISDILPKYTANPLKKNWSDGTENVSESLSMSYDKVRDSYKVDLTVPISYDWCVLAQIVKGYGTYYARGTDVGDVCSSEVSGYQKPRYLTSYGEEIEPVSLIVNIDGDKFSIDLKSTNISVGAGSNVTSVENNELLQRENYTTDSKSGLTKNLIKSGYQKVVDKYKNGKETLKLKLAVGEYYDTDGNLAISTKDGNLKMIFEIGDEVVPYKNSALGKDLPMSVDKSGNAKTFIVVGTRIIYGGVLYQEITLQEKVS